MTKLLKLRNMRNPFGRDLLPLDLDIDVEWLVTEMLRTGKNSGEVIADYISDAIKADSKRASDINKQYTELFK